MTRLPALWAAAYGSHGSALRRRLSRRAIAFVTFIRALALTDHQPFTTL